MGSISALAKAESISLNHFELGRTTLFNQKFHQTPVYIKSIGSYDNITSFLKKVSLLAGVISLGDFTMTVENERYDASQLLSAVFTINLYSLSKELKINISGGSS